MRLPMLAVVLVFVFLGCVYRAPVSESPMETAAPNQSMPPVYEPLVSPPEPPPEHDPFEPPGYEVPSLSAPLLIGNFSCSGTPTIELSNNHISEPLRASDFMFFVNGEPSRCEGLPDTIPPHQSASCMLPASSEFKMVEIFANATLLNLGVGFSCVGNIEPAPYWDNRTYNLSAFRIWAAEQKISLVGTWKDADDLYYGVFDPDEDAIPLEEVPYWWWAEEGLRKLPDGVLRVMEDKTIYFSNKSGRGYAIPREGTTVLIGADAGFILEQTITDSQAVHELGHIVDAIGINVWNESSETLDIFADALDERNRIFAVHEEYDPSRYDVPAGFINVYSSANDQENFAEHFAHYVLYPEEFRRRMQNDSLLREKYAFFRDNIFEGREY